MLNITSAIDNSLLSLIIVKMVKLHNAPCKPTHFVHLYILIFDLKVGLNLKARQGLVNCIKTNSANIIFSLFWPWQQYSLPDILYTNIFANIILDVFLYFRGIQTREIPVNSYSKTATVTTDQTVYSTMTENDMRKNFQTLRPGTVK